MFHQPQPVQHPGSAAAPASSAYPHTTARVIKLGIETPSRQRSFSVAVFVLLASIDNTILTMLPSALPLIGDDLAVSEAALGLAIGAQLLVMALTAVGWGYLSDRIDRRTVLTLGTLAWAIPIGLLTRATSYSQFAILLALAGVGLGCVMTAGYSIMTDLVGPQRRGLLLSLWGGVQSLGAGVGPLLIGLLAPTHGWRVPFVLVAAIGLGLAACARLAVTPPKGSADPELSALHEGGMSYTYRITRSDLRTLLGCPSNRWLMLQGVIGQLAYGALQWLPALLTAKLLAQGVPLVTAAAIGALLFPITQIGGVFGIVGGYLGDRLQRRDLRARALLAGSGLWLSVPAYLVFFWLPLPLDQISLHTAPIALVLHELAHNPYLWLSLAAALLATAANAINAPNWYALVTDVNLPEQRGTAFSLVALANSTGRALGSAAAGGALALLGGGAVGSGSSIASAGAYAWGLTLFTLCFIPAGVCFFRAATSAPHDISAARATLAQRATRQERAQ